MLEAKALFLPKEPQPTTRTATRVAYNPITGGTTLVDFSLLEGDEGFSSASSGNDDGTDDDEGSSGEGEGNTKPKRNNTKRKKTKRMMRNSTTTNASAGSNLSQDELRRKYMFCCLPGTVTSAPLSSRIARFCGFRSTTSNTIISSTNIGSGDESLLVTASHTHHQQQQEDDRDELASGAILGITEDAIVTLRTYPTLSVETCASAIEIPGQYHTIKQRPQGPQIPQSPVSSSTCEGETSSFLPQLVHSASRTRCSASPTPEFVVSRGFGAGCYRACDLHRATKTLDGVHFGGVTAMAVGEEHSNVVALGSSDLSISVWRGDDDVLVIDNAHADWVRCLFFFSDEKGMLLMISGGDDGVLQMWDPLAGMLLCRSRLSYTSLGIRAATFCPKKRVLAVGDDHGLSLISVANRHFSFIRGTSMVSGSLGHKTGAATALAFSEGGELLVAAFEDETLRLFDTLLVGPEGASADSSAATAAQGETRMRSSSNQSSPSPPPPPPIGTAHLTTTIIITPEEDDNRDIEPLVLLAISTGHMVRRMCVSLMVNIGSITILSCPPQSSVYVILSSASDGSAMVSVYDPRTTVPAVTLPMELVTSPRAIMQSPAPASSGTQSPSPSARGALRSPPFVVSPTSPRPSLQQLESLMNHNNNNAVAANTADVAGGVVADPTGSRSWSYRQAANQFFGVGCHMLGQIREASYSCIEYACKASLEKAFTLGPDSSSLSGNAGGVGELGSANLGQMLGRLSASGAQGPTNQAGFKVVATNSTLGSLVDVTVLK